MKDSKAFWENRVPKASRLGSAFLRRALAAAFLSLVLASPLTAAEFKEGVHYFPLEPEAALSWGSGPDVLLWLWYGCGACYQLDKYWADWAQKLPPELKPLRRPALFTDTWRRHGRLFMTVEALGGDAAAHRAAFLAIQKERLPTNSDAELRAFAAELGLPPQHFVQLFHSPELDRSLAELDGLFQKSGLRAVPAMVIGGRWRFDLGSAGSLTKFQRLADYLVEKELQRKKEANK